jgi:hypothetical protein
LILNAPAGLSAGDKFRFLFVTAGRTVAFSRTLNHYDTFVQNDVATNYGTATYNGAVVTDWKVVGSVYGVIARAHIGDLADVSIWLPNGTKIADNQTTSTNGLWSGSLLNAPNSGLNGESVGTLTTFTGTLRDGEGSMEAHGAAWHREPESGRENPGRTAGFYRDQGWGREGYPVDR